MAMKTIILDSSPSVNLHEPSNISLNVSPAYTGQSKKRGQPLLGQRQMHYTHFVPMGQPSQHIKELLAIEETDNSESKAIEGRNDLLKAEKVMKGMEKTSSSINPPFDSNFEREAKEYMETPQNNKEDTFQANDDDQSAADTTAKNDATIATLIASTQPKTPARKPSKPRKKKSAKKPPKNTKKMKKFRIMRKKK